MVNTTFLDMTAFSDRNLNSLKLSRSKSLFCPKKGILQYIGVSMTKVIIDSEISPPIFVDCHNFFQAAGLLTVLELMEWFCGGKTVQKGHSEC